MTQGLPQPTSLKNVRVVPVDPHVKSAKTRELFNAGVIGNSKTAKTTDPTCYNVPVGAGDTARHGLFEKWRTKMTIYTRMGSPVQFTSARIVKVWTTVGNIGNGVECKWHYAEPKRTSRWRKDVRVETMHVWHVKAQYKDGEPVCGGDEIPLNGFVADGAIQEIIAECYRINPTDAKWEKETFGEAA